MFYTQIAGLPYTFSKLHGFGTVAVGQVYWTMWWVKRFELSDDSIGGVIGFAGNFIQEKVYRIKAPKRGVEARLYAPMVAGIFFAIGCFITGFTSVKDVHWIAPCIGITVILGESIGRHD